VSRQGKCKQETKISSTEMRDLHIIYVTARTPWGKGEDFVLSEILELRAQGHRVTVCPTRPGRDLWVGNEPADVAMDAIYLPWLGARTLLYALYAVALQPLRTVRVILRLLLSSRSLIIALKNLSVIPKGLALAWSLRLARPDHIHAHWASTSSSAAMIAAETVGVPWSFTAHRGDIREDNCLRTKVLSAAFVRVISDKGVRQLREKVSPECANKILCVHMGCRMETRCDSGGFRSVAERIDYRRRKRVIACPANLLPVKGHAVLLSALAQMKSLGMKFSCIMMGNGPLEGQLRQQTKDLGLEELVEWRGKVAHDELLRMYIDNQVSIVVLPSIRTDDGVEEGIPVSLIEAMAAGLPVVSTDTGAIPELLVEGAGIMVRHGDAEALASALTELLENEEMYSAQAFSCKQRARRAFDLRIVASTLVDCFFGCS
jgi:colanic acid/amylovoran biosynthesis glycosyltransferase